MEDLSIVNIETITPDDGYDYFFAYLFHRERYMDFQYRKYKQFLYLQVFYGIYFDKIIYSFFKEF